MAKKAKPTELKELEEIKAKYPNLDPRDKRRERTLTYGGRRNSLSLILNKPASA